MGAHLKVQWTRNKAWCTEMDAEYLITSARRLVGYFTGVI